MFVKKVTVTVLAGLGLFFLIPTALALGEEQVIVFPTEDQVRSHFRGNSALYLALDTISDLGQSILGIDTPSPLHDYSKSREDLFLLASSYDKYKYTTPLLLDSKDDQAIHVAAQTFINDIYKVTGQKPELYNDTLPSNVKKAIVLGSVNSNLVKHVKGNGNEAKDIADGLRGKWESWDIRHREKPLHGLDEGLVIVGSDRRGTIYALYTLSEQLGISPYYFWSDVPIRPRSAVAFDTTRTLSHGEPTVKYRGLFINDEHPALWAWAANHYGLDRDTPAFQVWMYEPWFEMMLRLKANYFWPAMWASKFSMDGLDTSNGQPPPIPGPNEVLANKMGIVIGASHHEPMGRNKPEWDEYGKGPWDWTNKDVLKDFWRYGAQRAKGLETLFTMGMRGDGDEALTGASNALVQNITHEQQEILKDVYETDDLSKISQMWCMYKEVAGYYMNGLEVPEDITVLFADDNWGNLMSVLPEDRQGHKAGAGIYYHVDYVGFPRDYKWIHTINLAKTWEQMNIARAFNTTSIWILNIGTLKPLELPTEHFLALAYDSDAWPRNSDKRFTKLWAAREFGEEHSEEVGDIMVKYSMYASRHKAELVNAKTWSLVNYEEAERTLEQWDDLVSRSGKIYDKLDEETKPAFFQLVYMLCMAQANLNRLHIAVARSNLYAYQARTATNVFAKEAIDSFYQDFNITEMFHSLLDRKWDHMWAQTHINYYDTLEPVRDSLPPINFINAHQATRVGIPIKEHSLPGHVAYIRLTVENSYGAWPGDTLSNCPNGHKCPDPTLLTMDPYGVNSRWVDIGAGGFRETKFTAEPNVDWLVVTPNHGKIKGDATKDARVYISVNWDKVPKSILDKELNTQGEILFKADDNSNVTVTVPIHVPSSPPKDFKGHVQGDGYIVMEAAHFSRNSSSEGYAYEEMEGYGRTLSGVEMFPITNKNFTLGTGPKLEYDFWTHGDSIDGENTIELTVQIGPTLNFLMGKELAFGLQLDNHDPKEIHPIPVVNPDPAKQSRMGAVPQDWLDVVSSEIRNITIPLQVENWEKGGKHTVSIYGMTTGIVLERIWVDLGGIKKRGYSYLGPPESHRV